MDEETHLQDIRLSILGDTLYNRWVIISVYISTNKNPHVRIIIYYNYENRHRNYEQIIRRVWQNENEQTVISSFSLEC